MRSVNTPDYPVSDWIINPDMSAVLGVNSKYWRVTGNIVSVMSAPEMAAIDAAALEAGDDAIADEINSKGLLKAFALVMLDQINELRDDHGRGAISASQLKTAIRSKL